MSNGCESDARDARTAGRHIGALNLGRRTRWAEVNGAKVMTAVDLPESVLDALVALVDAVQTEFGEAEDWQRAADAAATERAKPLCRWHPGQYAEHCGPCRSERIAAR
jgi:hypothetical protein